MYANLPLKLISIYLYILSRRFYDDYYYVSRFRNKNIVLYKKYFKRVLFYIKILLIFVHPLYPLKRTKGFITEYYFYDSLYWPFNRYINDYFFII